MMGKQRQMHVFTAAESAEVWGRWQRGEGLKLIGLPKSSPCPLGTLFLAPFGLPPGLPDRPF